MIKITPMAFTKTQRNNLQANTQPLAPSFGIKFPKYTPSENNESKIISSIKVLATKAKNIFVKQEKKEVPDYASKILPTGSKEMPTLSNSNLRYLKDDNTFLYGKINNITLIDEKTKEQTFVKELDLKKPTTVKEILDNQKKTKNL